MKTSSLLLLCFLLLAVAVPTMQRGSSGGSGIRGSVGGSGIRGSVGGSGIRGSVLGSGIRGSVGGSGIRGLSGIISGSKANLKSSDSGRPKGPTGTDLNGGQMRALLGQQVVRMTKMERPLGRLGTIGRGIGDWKLSHTGTLIETADGKKYLIHKGHNFGREKGGNTVVTDASNMSSEWKPAKGAKEVGVKPNTSVSDMIRVGGKDYNLLLDNCHTGTRKIGNIFGRRN